VPLTCFIDIILPAWSRLSL